MWNLKYVTNKYTCDTDTDTENGPVVAEGAGGRNGSLGLADANGYTGWASNKILLHSTGDHIQYPAINCKEKGIRKNVYMTESLLI